MFTKLPVLQWLKNGASVCKQRQFDAAWSGGYDRQGREWQRQLHCLLNLITMFQKSSHFYFSYLWYGVKGDWDFQFSDLAKTSWNWFNPCGEFRWSLECPVSEIHSPHLHVGAPGIFSDAMQKATGSVCVFSNANPLHYYALRVPHWVDRWCWVWSFKSCTTGADHITCGTRIFIVYCRKLRLGWLYV